MLTAQLVKANEQQYKVAVKRFPKICHLAKSVIFLWNAVFAIWQMVSG